ncbi:MAG: hypothetical protein LBC18_03865, partial [Opitutaceae bacterium]|nr:hypothetical protein [Opitutaceae bacterium]
MKNLPIAISKIARDAVMAALALAAAANAQQTVPPSGTHTFTADTIYDPVERQATTAPLVYYIEDDRTVTFQNASSSAGSGGVFYANNANHSITIAPSGTLGTGRVVLKKNSSTAEGGVFYNAGPLSVTNADFIENAGSNGGVLRNTSASGPIEFTQARFEGNHAANGGVFASYGNIT